MLQYREFPLRTAAVLVLFSAPVSLCIYIITGLVSGTLLGLSLPEHHGLLGIGALAATVVLPITGLIVDRMRFHDHLLLLSSLLPATGVLLRLFPVLPASEDQLNLILAVFVFSGLAASAVLWTIRANQSVVARYRGRTVALFVALVLVLLGVFTSLPQLGVVLNGDILVIPAFISLFAVLLAAAFRPWKFSRASFGAAGSAGLYFVPMVFVLAAHMLWYFVTKTSIGDFFAGDSAFESLTQFTGLEFGQLMPLAIGAIVSAVSADIRGRKASFSTLLFMMGLLTIFGSAVYQTYFELTDVTHTTWTVLLVSLVLSERFIEGYMLGLCLFLIWPEIGSARSKGLRLSLIWFFFLGYMTLFWAVDLNATVFGLDFHFPSVLRSFGGEFAILFSLIGLYLIGPLPEVLGREIEMEDLSLEFDERQVRKTVDAFVGADDFESIRSQLDIIDAGQEISDSDMSEILGEDSKDKLQLRRIPGIGEALEKKIRAAGYESAAQLAGETAQRLAQKVDGLSTAKAEAILKEARKIVKKTIKKNKRGAS